MGGIRMNPLVIWVVWGVFAFVAVLLGFVACHFTIRTLRWVTTVIAGLLVVLITRYGLTHPANASSDLVNAFRQGANELATAFFHPLLLVLPGNRVRASAPGRIGWLVVAVLLVGSYRLLEAWAIRRQAPVIDTAALDSKSDDASSKAQGSAEDRQLYDELVARLKFQLSAIEVRAPAIVPGGSRSNGLASIAEASGVNGSGLAGAIIQFFGMLWPNPRRFQVRVRVERAPLGQHDTDTTKVTVSLDEPATGESVATKTMTADNIEEAAALVAGYVARHIFIRDPTTPPWCVGAASGRDLAAMLLAKQGRVHARCRGDIESARKEQILILEKATGNTQYAGLLRYELAQLYDLAGKHVEALRLHAINREQHPRFYRGRYRLSMSLEMIANPEFRLPDTDKTEHGRAVLEMLDESLAILGRCGLTEKVKLCGDDTAGKLLQPKLRKELLKVAGTELRAIRRQLTLWHVIWGTLRCRDERVIRMLHWRLRERQSFRDGLCVAELLVAIRRSLNGECLSGISGKRHMRLALRLTAGIAHDDISIKQHLADRKAQGTPGPRGTPESPDREWPSSEKRNRTRRLPWQCRTPSWEAAYNAACAYAALKLDRQVVNSLRRAISNPYCEMQRPSDWIAHDPDFKGVESFEKFKCFLKNQKREDYPAVAQCPGHADGEETAAGRDVPGSPPEGALAGSVVDMASVDGLSVGQAI